MFFSLYGVGWLNLAGFVLLIVDPIIFVVMRFSQLQTMKARAMNIGMFSIFFIIVTGYLALPKPGCDVNSICIPVATLSQISLTDVSIAAVISIALIAALFVIFDFLVLIMKREVD